MDIDYSVHYFMSKSWQKAEMYDFSEMFWLTGCDPYEIYSVEIMNPRFICDYNRKIHYNHVGHGSNQVF